MKRTMVSVLMIIVSCLVYADVSITDVTAQQRYPWNGKVDISYTVTGIVEEAKQEGLIATLKVSAIDLTTSTTNIATMLSGDVSLADGTHKIVWDMNAQGLTFKSTNIIFNISCEAETARYCIIDLSAGEKAKSYPVSYINDVPGGSWSDEYKTTKLVLRHIDYSSPFYIGVFEVTQKQYALITGITPSYFLGDLKPVEQVSYNMIRGSDAKTVEANSFMGKLGERINKQCDLPSESKWEYACRAGTTTTYSFGDGDPDEYMWYELNSDSSSHDVGSLKPNEWGLYDMHGNIFEWCNGNYSGNNVVRGGSWGHDAASCTSSSRGGNIPTFTTKYFGFRVAMNAKKFVSTNFCYGCSGKITVNLAQGARKTRITESLTYSTSWADGASDDATAIVEVDGAAISEECGSGIIEWTPQYNGVFVLTHKVMDGGVQIGEAYTATFQVDHWKADIPVIEPEATLFPTVSQEVTLSCETEGATIYYTIDGSEPSAANGRRYKGPFDIWQTTTVKAIAVKDDWKDSAVASATFTKENAIGPAINLLEVLPDNDKTHPWEVVTDMTHDGVSAVKSGAIEDEESTTIKAVIYGAGELSFWWKSSCEPSIGGEYYDYGTFYNGSTAVTNIAGVTDWQQVRLAVPETGKHTFKWTYTKDDSGSTVPDGIWLDQVQWLPETTDYYADHTLTTETPVEYKWLRKYGLGVTNDFEAATKAKSGKRDGAGRELTVEDDYIAGTDPTNMTSQLTSQIEMIDGVPNITWNPDLEGDRTYKIWGSTNLVNGGDWKCPTNALHRFFKVTVEMP